MKTPTGMTPMLLVTIDLNTKMQLRILFRVYKKLRFLYTKFKSIILINPLQFIDYLILTYFGLILVNKCLIKFCHFENK